VGGRLFNRTALSIILTGLVMWLAGFAEVYQLDFTALRVL